MDINKHKVSKPWLNFVKRLETFSQLEVRFWKETQLLGYFCQLYQQYLGIPYALSYTGTPTKCSEIMIIKKMMVMFNSERPLLIKSYMDWIFSSQVEDKKTKITSIGFLLTPRLINQFQLTYQKQNTITKSTLLPEEYQQVAQTLNIPVSTYGDLAFVKLAADQDTSIIRDPQRSLLKTLQNLGLEVAVLDGLK